MRSTLMLCLFIAFAGCRSTIAQPSAAVLSVYDTWPPDPAPTAPVAIRLSPAEWDSIRDLLPDLDVGERKIWTNAMHRLTLVLVTADGREVAQGTFDEPDRIRLTFPDHTSSFQNVSSELQKRLIDMAKSRGHWQQ